MPTFYIINSATRELVRQSSSPFNIDESVQPPAPLIQLKRVDDDTRPVFDEATQKLERIFTDDDVAFTRTFSWQIVALTTEEQAVFQQRLQDEQTRLLIKSVYQDLKSGVGTNIERLVRVERAIAWLLREFVK